MTATRIEFGVCGLVEWSEELRAKAWRQGPGKGDFIMLSAIPNLSLQGIPPCALENKLLTALNTTLSLVYGEGQDSPTGTEVAQRGEAESGEPSILHVLLQTWTDVVTSTPQFRMEYIPCLENTQEVMEMPMALRHIG